MAVHHGHVDANVQVSDPPGRAGLQPVSEWPLDGDPSPASGNGAPGPTTLELKSLYLAPDQRGTGLASRLLVHAIGTTSSAFLWVFEENLRAQAFYRKHGFAPDGVRTTDTGTGVAELRMSRNHSAAATEGGSR